MKSNEIFDHMFNLGAAPGPDGESANGTSAIRIKELSERDRRRILMHFLSLDSEDRRLRFGSPLPDELVTRYVQRLDFGRDAVFGVHDDSFRLIGVGHLGFAPRTEVPLLAEATTKERIAELGVSVLPAARGLGVGTRLFERAAIHCRNADVDTLMMHCLASNQAMIHIAKKAGMQIQRAYGEADAYLTLSPASPGSMLREAVQEQVATLDYAYKANNRAAVKLLRRIGVNKSDSSKK
jgi:GNAT superfamily N-acetyltransferase